MKYTYIIPGDPTPSGKIRNGNRARYDAQKMERAHFSINLAQQHDDKPLIYGPLHLQIHFFLPLVHGCNETFRYGTPCYTLPRLSSLVNYVEECARGILLPDECTIVSAESRKSFDDNPRIEFSLITLEKDGKTWKHFTT